MRARFLLAVSLLLGPTYLGCQLVEPQSDLTESARDDGSLDAAPPADAGAFCLGVDAAVCDGFDEDGPIVAVPAENIAPVVCDMGSITVDGGRLDVEHPANGGAMFSTCSFEGDPAGAIGHFTLDYDLRYRLAASDASTDFVIISSVTVGLATPDDAGLEDIAFQLLVDGTGAGQLVATPYYPDASKSPQKGNNFPSYHLAATDTPGVILPQNTDCHVSIAVDAVAVTGAVTVVCGGKSTTMPTELADPPPPAGMAAPATLLVGYTQLTEGTPQPDWSLSYDNVLLLTYP